MSTNRIIRIVVGLALIGYGVYSANAWFFLGLAPLLTGLINWCPLEMKMGTCDPASGCCATPTDSKSSSCCSTSQDTSSACCSTPAPQATWSTTKQESACCSDDTECCGEDTIKIEVLGTGCKKCKMLEDAAKEAIKELEGEYCVIKVEEIEKIMAYGVTNTPALVINGEVKSSGKLLEVHEIQALLK